ACYAALQLQEELRRYAEEIRLELGLGFSVRMGINSGEVLVGKIGDDLRMDYAAQGHTVGLAARMEQIAEPGAVIATATKRKLVEGFSSGGASDRKGSKASQPLTRLANSSVQRNQRAASKRTRHAA